jgi:putative flavoprotein involved in K+ transport
VERGGEQVTLKPKQRVFALGVSGYANVPKIEGTESFKGEQHHRSKRLR